MFKTVLCPVDVNEPGLEARAIATALPMVKASGGTLTLLAVVLDSPVMAAEYLPPDFRENQVREAQDALARLARETGLPENQIDVKIRHGRPYHEILEEARAAHTDLIVMASHRPGLSTYLLGSNSTYVVRHAACSVMVIRDEAA
ncbi:MAG: universal stress protein [Phreatobacter sp.]